MASKQTVLALVFLSLIIALFFVFQKIDTDSLKDKFSPKPPPASPPAADQNGQDIISKAGQFIEDEAKKTAQNLGDLLGEKTQTALEDFLPKKNPPKVSAVENPPTGARAVSIIDLSKDSTIKLNLVKNNKYYLDFANVPPNYCLYIGINKYPIPQDKNLEVEFISSGTFSVKANACDLGDKNLGEITVE